jgi:hypothetical protein
MMLLPPDWLEQLQAVYPRRDGPHWWVRVRTILPQSVSAGATWDQILAGTKGYAAYCDRQGFSGTSYVKPACNFFDYRTQGWGEDFSVPEKPKSPAERVQEARWAALQARRAACGFRPPTPIESPDVYETQLRSAEREQLESRGTYSGQGARSVPNVVAILTQTKRIAQ